MEGDRRQCVELFRKECSGRPEVPGHRLGTRRACAGRIPNSMLKDPLSPGRLTKVQIQGGVTHPRMGTRRGVRRIPFVVGLPNHAASAQVRGVPVRRMGPRRWAFSAAC